MVRIHQDVTCKRCALHSLAAFLWCRRTHVCWTSRSSFAARTSHSAERKSHYGQSPQVRIRNRRQWWLVAHPYGMQDMAHSECCFWGMPGAQKGGLQLARSHIVKCCTSDVQLPAASERRMLARGAAAGLSDTQTANHALESLITP